MALPGRPVLAEGLLAYALARDVVASLSGSFTEVAARLVREPLERILRVLRVREALTTPPPSDTRWGRLGFELPYVQKRCPGLFVETLLEPVTTSSAGATKAGGPT